MSAATGSIGAAPCSSCGAAIWAALALGNLAYRHVDRQDYAAAGDHLERGLQWAGRIEPEFDRNLTEAKLLTISAMVSEDLCRLDEARQTLLGVLSRGVALGSRRLQLSAIDNLANVAGTLGRWAERADWGRRMLELPVHPRLKRMIAMARDEGLTKLLLDKKTRRILGAGIVGVSAGELIAETVLGLEMGADMEDIGLTIHPHPTLSETVFFAAEIAEGSITDLYMPKK